MEQRRLLCLFPCLWFVCLPGFRAVLPAEVLPDQGAHVPRQGREGNCQREEKYPYKIIRVKYRPYLALSRFKKKPW